MSLLFIVLFLGFFRTNQSIDRTQYSNRRATERQDGYLSFASNNMNFPLHFRWNVSTTCNNDYLAFGNNTLYCLTNDLDGGWQYNYPTAMQAFDIKDGQIYERWTTYIYPKQEGDWTLDVGPVLVPPNYAAVFEQQRGVLFVLNTETGNIAYKIFVDGDDIYCQGDPPCLMAGITSSAKYQTIFVHYAKSFDAYDNYDGQAYLFYFDMNNNQTGTLSIHEPQWSSPSTPTICDDVIITTNYFGSVDAFRISSDKDRLNLQPLWNYTMPRTRNDDWYDYYNPPLCIPRSDGSFNVLTNAQASEANFSNEYFELLDGQTGKLLQEFLWYEEKWLPAINTDQWIMIRTTCMNQWDMTCTQDTTHRIIAYNVSGSNSLNGNWTEIWNIQGVLYEDIMIVNDYLFLSRPAGVDVFSIYDGKLMESTMMPVDFALSTSLVASVDRNNNPLIIAASCVQSSIFDQNPIETVLFAINFSD
eukprot:510210_1